MVGVEAFIDWVELESWPAPSCPACGVGFLAGEDKLEKNENGSSLAWRKEEAWDPDWIHGVLSGCLTCNNHRCGEVVAVGGIWRVGDSRDPYQQYSEQLTLKYFQPALQLIRVPSKTPVETANAVRDASGLLLINPSAAANRLRQGIEALLTAKKVRRFTVATRRDGSTSRVRLSLHARIDIFRASEKDVADGLEAVKWIGNDGSHESGLTAQEVLVGARILEVALHELFESRDPEIERNIKRIIKNKGIRKRK